MSLRVSYTIPYLKYLAEETKIGDPIEAPPGPYKIQPENQGKLLWITGSPGVGKSTSAQLLGRKKGKIYHDIISQNQIVMFKGFIYMPNLNFSCKYFILLVFI